MKLGIIGVGKWGRNYFRTFLELGATVKWICARSESTLKKALEEVKADVKTTTNYKDILEDSDVDAVAVSTPDPTHYQIVKDSLEAGKHVLVEKPFTLNSQEAEELVKLAEEKKKVLMVGHIHRFNPGIQKIKEDIDAGLFGKISFIQSIGTGTDARSDTSALWDYMPHDLTILSYLLGSYPESVRATGVGEEQIDFVTAEMKIKDTFAVCLAGWIYPVKKRELVVVGEKLSAIYDDYKRELKYYNGDEGVIALNDAMPLTEELKHFLDCIENNKKPVTDGHEGLKVVKVLEACEESIKKDGEPVKV